MAKRRLLKYQIITNGDMSQATVTSVVTNTNNIDTIGMQIVWTGAAVGTFDVQVSADYAQDSLGNVTNTGTWSSLTLNPVPAASGTASNIYIDMSQVSFPWIRLKYTKTSSTGTLQAYITGKENG